MDQDGEHLRLLSIFHYVVAGMVGLVALVPVFHLVLGLGMVGGWLDQPGHKDPLLPVVGWFFVALAGMMIAGLVALAISTALAGRFLARRRRYTFCLVVAALLCTFMPVGTALGVFTLLVLVRPSVRALFA